jgi:hypothetical protein
LFGVEEKIVEGEEETRGKFKVQNLKFNVVHAVTAFSLGFENLKYPYFI